MIFYIIENYEQLTSFYYKGIKEAFIEIIPFNDNTHPAINKVSLVYIKPISDDKGYMLCVNHNDALGVKMKYINDIINSIDKIYVRDKKEFLHYFIHPNCIDLTLKHVYDKHYTLTHNFFYRNHPHIENINCIIPLTKHYELCDNIFNDLKLNICEPYNVFYNDKASIVFNAIERNGIRIQTEKFKEYFNLSSNSEYVYSQYNFKTTTRRPSNRFNNINFAALNKENGCRESFIPRNDTLIEIDLSAFHPTLISKLMSYDFGDKNIYHEIEKECNVSYDEAKRIIFKNLNGEIFTEYKNVEFFKSLQKFKDKIWSDFQTNGYIEDEISGWRFYSKDLDNMNPNKLLNYLLQITETSTNINILWDMFKILRNKNTKLILFTYDAFLFDLDKNEEKIINNIMDIFKKYQFNVKTKIGLNYNNLLHT
jgi:hypothetical protein